MAVERERERERERESNFPGNKSSIPSGVLKKEPPFPKAYE